MKRILIVVGVAALVLVLAASFAFARGPHHRGGGMYYGWGGSPTYYYGWGGVPSTNYYGWSSPYSYRYYRSPGWTITPYGGSVYSPRTSTEWYWDFD
ncbi:MAG: hypothetical protein AB1646_15415 [Thermodesulfobacteriota bacterium]